MSLGNFNRNQIGILVFLNSYNGTQGTAAPNIPFNKEATNLYDLLCLQDTPPHSFKDQCIALLRLIRPCFSGRHPNDPFFSEVTDVPEALIQDDTEAVQDYPTEISDSLSDVDLSDYTEEEEEEEEDPGIKLAKQGHAFILYYLNAIESGTDPKLGTFQPYDPTFAKRIAKRDAPPREVIKLTHSFFSSPSDEGARALPLALARAPAQQVQPRQRPLEFYETLEWLTHTNFLAEGAIALRAAQRQEWKRFLGTTGVSLAIPAMGFGAGALVGFGVIKLGVAVIAIAGVSFPPLLFIGAVVAVAATIAYCCIKKYKQSPLFAKKHPPKIPPQPALLFSAQQPKDPGSLRYEAFRPLFENLYKNLVEPLEDSALPSLKKLRATLEYPSALEHFNACALKGALQRWKTADAVPGNQPRALLENFSQIMKNLASLKTNTIYRKDIRDNVNQNLCKFCTKEMWDFYSAFIRYEGISKESGAKRTKLTATLNKHTPKQDQTAPEATA